MPFIPWTFITEGLAEAGPSEERRGKNRPGHHPLLPAAIWCQCDKKRELRRMETRETSTLTRPRVKNCCRECWILRVTVGSENSGVQAQGPNNREAQVNVRTKCRWHLKKASHHWKAWSAGDSERTNGTGEAGRGQITRTFYRENPRHFASCPVNQWFPIGAILPALCPGTFN